MKLSLSLIPKVIRTLLYDTLVAEVSQISADDIETYKSKLLSVIQKALGLS